MDNEEKILEAFGNLNKKCQNKTFRIKDALYPQVEKAIAIWMKQLISKNISISGHMIKSKAVEYAIRLGIKNFKPTDGYVRGLKKRQNIAFINLRGQSNSVDIDKIENWIPKLKEIIKGYDASEIFNCEETGLFWKLLPTKTFCFNDSSKKGTKKFHDRVTVLLFTNMNGTERSIFVIGKSKNPRCFNGIDRNEINKIYFNQNNAWMSSDIFEKIILEFDKKMKFKNKRVLLFLDNHSTHLISHDLSNVKLIYFPPTTSVLQPLDQGIIRNFKHFYTKNIISFMISNLNESNIDSVKNISLLTAINFIKTAWSSVVNETILNCFKKGFFQIRTLEEIEHEI